MSTFPLRRGFTVYSRFRETARPDHWGVDFGREGGSGGEAVHAVRPGTVIRNGKASGFGWWVLVDHPAEVGGGTSVYGHVIPEVQVGQVVAEGQRIARINPDSLTNGGVPPHLHLEFHRTVWAQPGRDRLDPLAVLGDAGYPGETAPAAPTPAPTTEQPVTDLQYGVDISNHQAGIDVGAIAREGFAAVIAKASQGNYYVDREFPRHCDLARAAGMTVTGYHYVEPGDPAGNARTWDKAVRGDRTVACMLDHENGSGTLADLLAVKSAIEALGYRVVLAYVPRWYWSGAMGGGDLSRLGCPLMASSYGNDQPGFAAALYEGGGKDRWGDYGGGRVALLQFTQRAKVAGRQIDAWAFRGSRAQLDALLTGTTQTQEDPDVAFTDDQARKLDAIHSALTTGIGADAATDKYDGRDWVGDPRQVWAKTLQLAQVVPTITAAVTAAAQQAGSGLTPEQITEAVQKGLADGVIKVDVSVAGGAA